MKWVSSFKYLPINYAASIATARDRTQRVSFDNNLNGDRIRLHLTNRYGKALLRLDRVTIGRETGAAVIDTADVTLDGQTSIVLQPGQELYSDEIPFTARAGDRLAVSIYFAEAQNIESVCCLWSRTNTLVSFGAGDQTDGQAFEEAELDNLLPLIRDDPSPYKTMFFCGFDAVQIYTADEVKVVAAFGDSITHMSFVTNALTKQLYDAYPGKVALINSGIGGNRLVHDATCIKSIGQVVPVFGDAGVKRFEKDVFELDQVDTVLALIGINDIMHPMQLEEVDETTPPEEIIKGYQTIAAITHAHGAKIFGATVMPCGNDSYPENWLPTFEKTRQALNAWIRGENDYDGYFDYDAAMRDDSRSGFLLPGVDIGDGLHPNDRGGKIVADTIDLAQLTGLE